MHESFSIVLPCYNEEANIASTVHDVLSWFAKEGISGEVVVVNDGSSDGTGIVLSELEKQHPELVVVTHERNRGYGSAVRSGMDRASKEWIGYMDSDGQFKASDFSKLLPFTSGHALISGRRRKRADPFMRKVNAKGFALLNLIVLGIWVRDINCAMKLFRRDIWPKVRPEFATGALFNAEVFYRARRQGIAWKQCYVEHYPRRAGRQTGANLKVIARMFRDMARLRIAAIR